MNFEVRETVESGVVVVGVRGELDLDTCGELRRRLEASDARAPVAILDLSECAFIDSTGVSLLVRAFRRAEADGGPGLVVVAAPGGQVRRTLRLTNVDSNIPVLGSLEGALAAVR